MSIETVSEVLSLLFDAYPRAEVNEGTNKVYLMTLQDIEPLILKAAVLKHITECKWFPTVAELREAAGCVLERANGEPDGYTAWAEVLQQIDRVGSYRVPQFSFKRIQKALDGIGGWKALCMSENLVSDRMRFIEAYNVYEARDKETRQMLPAVGQAIAKLAQQKRVMIGVGLTHPATGEVLETYE